MTNVKAKVTLNGQILKDPLFADATDLVAEALYQMQQLTDSVHDSSNMFHPQKTSLEM